ncbi:hypothetical protein U1Q18_013012 [Sarracenia purpurea var. burkii]
MNSSENFSIPETGHPIGKRRQDQKKNALIIQPPMKKFDFIKEPPKATAQSKLRAHLGRRSSISTLFNRLSPIGPHEISLTSYEVELLEIPSAKLNSIGARAEENLKPIMKIQNPELNRYVVGAEGGLRERNPMVETDQIWLSSDVRLPSTIVKLPCRSLKAQAEQ